jgi:hypothetical protein
MNLRRLRKGEWITAISGLVLLVSLFLPWWNLPVEGAYFERSIGAPEFGGVTEWANVSAWEVLSVTDVLLAALGVFAVAVLLINAKAANTAPGVASEALLTLYAVVMSIVCVIRVLNLPEPLEPFDAFVDVGTEYGAWIGLAATLGVLVGALVGMRDERLSKPGELTDQTGVPVERAPEIEKLPAPPAA